MAKVFQLPANDVRQRTNIKELLKGIISEGNYDPSVSEDMLKTAMEIYDRRKALLDNNFKVSIPQTEGEPYTQRQIDSITVALQGVREQFDRDMSNLLLELVTLKMKLISNGIE